MEPTDTELLRLESQLGRLATCLLALAALSLAWGAVAIGEFWRSHNHSAAAWASALAFGAAPLALCAAGIRALHLAERAARAVRGVTSPHRSSPREVAR